MRFGAVRTSRLLRWLVGCWVLSAAPLLAAESCEQRSYQRASAAFAAARYEEAADFFKQAIACAPAQESYRYNLGVSYYKLGRWARAEQVFSQLLKISPHNRLYQYNLAVVLKKQGKQTQARLLFVALSAQDEAPRLAVLAQKQLQRLQGTASAAAAETHRARLQLRLASGHEEGLVDPAEQGIAQSSDSFTDALLFADYRYRPAGGSRDWLASLQYQRVDYRALNIYDYDIARLNLGVQQHWQQRRISLRVNGEYSHLGERAYLSALGAEAEWLQMFWRRPLTLRLAYKDYDSLSPRFEPLQGNRRLAMLSWDWLADKRWRWRSSYRVEDNARLDFSQPLLQLDYSPLRQSLHNDVFYRSGKWLYALRLQYRESRYGGENRYPDGLRARRIDRRLRADISVSRELLPALTAQLRYVYADSDSNIQRYDYRQNIAELALVYRVD